ncbi:hypothetical protein ACWKWK_00605 [Pseudoxanthomonas beigongshangi]
MWTGHGVGALGTGRKSCRAHRIERADFGPKTDDILTGGGLRKAPARRDALQRFDRD